MSAKTKLILGLVGAAAAGVVVGLLLAPDSGTATRRKIADTASDWTDQLGDLFSSAKDQVADIKKKGYKAASDVTRRAAEVKESYM
jgi:gas vesicle protein